MFRRGLSSDVSFQSCPLFRGSGVAGVAVCPAAGGVPGAPLSAGDLLKFLREAKRDHVSQPLRSC